MIKLHTDKHACTYARAHTHTHTHTYTYTYTNSLSQTHTQPSESAEILKIKQSMKEEAKLFEHHKGALVKTEAGSETTTAAAAAGGGG